MSGRYPPWRGFRGPRLTPFGQPPFLPAAEAMA